MHNNSTSSVHHGDHQYQYQYHPQRNIPSSVSHGKPEHHDDIFIYIIVFFFYMCYYLYIYILEEMQKSSTSAVHHSELQSHLPRSKPRNHDGKMNLILVWFSYKCYSFFNVYITGVDIHNRPLSSNLMRGLTHHNWEISLCKCSTYSVISSVELVVLVEVVEIAVV